MAGVEVACQPVVNTRKQLTLCGPIEALLDLADRVAGKAFGKLRFFGPARHELGELSDGDAVHAMRGLHADRAQNPEARLNEAELAQCDRKPVLRGFAL